MTTRLLSVVIDTTDPAGLGAWWAEAIGWDLVVDDDDEVTVEPPVDEGALDRTGDDDPVAIVPTLVFESVTEPKVVKNRLHLDLASDSVEQQRSIVARLISMGASRVDVGQGDVPWVVLADPEGNELCVLEPRDRYRDRGPIAAIVIDAADPGTLASFWTAASGWPIEHESDTFVGLGPPNRHAPDLEFVRVLDAKTVKNRVHLDVAPFGGGSRDIEAGRLISLGARSADVGQGPEVTWVVLTDPEGNEFCVLRPQ